MLLTSSTAVFNLMVFNDDLVTTSSITDPVINSPTYANAACSICSQPMKQKYFSPDISGYVRCIIFSMHRVVDQSTQRLLGQDLHTGSTQLQFS